MEITQQVRDYAGKLADPSSGSLPEESAQAPRLEG
jgi:hypothetical protein